MPIRQPNTSRIIWIAIHAENSSVTAPNPGKSVALGGAWVMIDESLGIHRESERKNYVGRGRDNRLVRED